MMQLKHSILVPGAVAGALLAACDKDIATANRSAPGKPNFTTCFDKPQDCGGAGPGFRITGGGRIDPAVGKTTFGFNVDGRSGPPYKGQMEVVYHGGMAPMLRIHSAVIDGFTSFDDPEYPKGKCARFGGWARTSDGHVHRFSTEACDNGEPGSSPGTGPDKFGIWVDGHGATGRTKLTGGNIQAHK